MPTRGERDSNWGHSSEADQQDAYTHICVQASKATNRSFLEPNARHVVSLDTPELDKRLDY